VPLILGDQRSHRQQGHGLMPRRLGILGPCFLRQRRAAAAAAFRDEPDHSLHALGWQRLTQMRGVPGLAATPSLDFFLRTSLRPCNGLADGGSEELVASVLRRACKSRSTACS